MEPIIGIYKITNKINGKSYVGQSVNIHKRWTSEKNNAFNPNAHEYNYPISRAFRKYGVENFSFEIIEQCSIGDDLDAKERHWIDIYDTYFHVKWYKVSILVGTGDIIHNTLCNLAKDTLPKKLRNMSQ